MEGNDHAAVRVQSVDCAVQPGKIRIWKTRLRSAVSVAVIIHLLASESRAAWEPQATIPVMSWRRPYSARRISSRFVRIHPPVPISRCSNMLLLKATKGLAICRPVRLVSQRGIQAIGPAMSWDVLPRVTSAGLWATNMRITAIASPP